MIELQQGDITQIEADAIVNAANSKLMGGGGVDGAIHRAGGSTIMEECIAIRNKQGGCRVGDAVITSGGHLRAKYVIHTVGPIYHNGIEKEDQLLASAYRNSLKLAIDNDIETIAFPNISTGVYNFPKQKAAEIAYKTVNEFLTTNDAIKKVIFVCFDDENYTIYSKLMKQ